MQKTMTITVVKRADAKKTDPGPCPFIIEGLPEKKQ